MSKKVFYSFHPKCSPISILTDAKLINIFEGEGRESYDKNSNSTPPTKSLSSIIESSACFEEARDLADTAATPLVSFL